VVVILFRSSASRIHFIVFTFNVLHSQDGFSSGANQGSDSTSRCEASMGSSHSNSDAGTPIFGSSGCHTKDVCCFNNTSGKSELISLRIVLKKYSCSPLTFFTLVRPPLAGRARPRNRNLVCDPNSSVVPWLVCT
jgi:hypothetical protein